jgi:hypothetical protein
MSEDGLDLAYGAPFAIRADAKECRRLCMLRGGQRCVEPRPIAPRVKETRIIASQASLFYSRARIMNICGSVLAGSGGGWLLYSC